MLEIGFSNVRRLEKIRKVFQVESHEIDPSPRAIKTEKGKYPNIWLKTGRADPLPFDDKNFDMIIFGFCLYLYDIKELFKITCEADRCLKNKGFLIFIPPFLIRIRYADHKGIYIYKMDYSAMFTWNPAYTEISKIVFSHRGFAL